MNQAQAQFQYAVFVGRFEPFHNAHLRVIERALAVAQKVIVLIGSANKPRTTKDPFFYEERKVMISASLSARDASRVIFAPIRDFPYSDDRWVREVQSAVAQAIVENSAVLNGPASVCMVGHFKDSTSDYLRMFPQWRLVEAPNHEQRSATDIRQLLFESATCPAEDARGKLMLMKAAVPDGVYDFLREFSKTEPFGQLVREYQFLTSYRAQFAQLPYPPVFVTVDAVVVHSGHILLVQRRAEPGKGLWALPGGFVGQHEQLLQACLRELREETRLKVPEPVLRGSVKATRVFDLPERSQRGRTITHGFFFDFPSGPLPAVKGGDDAVRARWVPLADFFDQYESQMFEDHFGIVSAFLGV